MRRLKLKQLEGILQQLDDFERPKLALEQYATPPHIAAHMLLHVAARGDLQGRSVLDLGCGCGALTVAAALGGAGHVTGVDVDEDALLQCAANVEELAEECPVSLVLGDVRRLSLRSSPHTVILNPPFGTKRNQGADIAFLEAAASFSPRAIYSLHKTSTRAYVLRRAKDLGLTGSVEAELRYDLPKTYRFHKRDSVDIQVDFIRFTKIK